jgi:hypothetical protein
MIGGSDIARLAELERRAQQQAEATAWPEGVIARYMNLVGATVDLRERGITVLARCSGCRFDVSSSSDGWVHDQAQAHAETCRALPRPEATR